MDHVTYAYDNTGAVTGIYENGDTSAGVLASFGYTNLGERASLTQGNGDVASYGYDAFGRLHTLALNLPGSGSDVTFTMNWNAAGQMTDRVAGNALYGYSAYADQQVGYTPNGLDRYTSVGGTNYTYTLHGDLKDDGPNSYGYNVLGQFKTFNATALTLDYDPDGRLYETDATNDTRLLYDGDDVIAEYSTTGTLLRRYVHGPGADEPLVWYEGSGTTSKRWLSADERGSVVAVTSGSATSVNTYDTFGVPGAANTGRFQYTGQQWLPEAGLYHYKNRTYSPKLGRFMQEDPIGNADGMNEYAYVGNDPMNGTDPSGLRHKTQVGARQIPVPKPEQPACDADICVTGHRLHPQNPPGAYEPINSVAQNGDTAVGDGVDPLVVTGHRLPSQKATGPRRPGFLGWLFGAGSNGNDCPKGVEMVSVSGSIAFPGLPKGFALNGGVGIAEDPHGNLAVPAFGFFGRSWGASESLTANYTTSNAQNFHAFEGLFAENNVTVGLGAGGGQSRFWGADNVKGLTTSIGEALGASFATGGSYTDIGPTINLGGCS